MTTFARTATNDLALPRVLVTDPASVALQTILDIFGLWQGEWFLDQLAGFPWAQQVLGIKNPNVVHIEQFLREAIMAAPFVVSVTANATFNQSLRSFSYSFVAQLDTGQQVVGGSNQAFHVVGEA